MADAHIRTLWFWRKGEDGPELLTAWDEWAVDGNYEGWRQDCERSFAEVVSDDSGTGPRELIFRFDYDKVEEAFSAADIEATVESNQESRPTDA